MIRANDSVTFVRKQHSNYMYEYVYIPQATFVNGMLCSLEFTFRNNYGSNSNMCRYIIEIKYMQESR